MRRQTELLSDPYESFRFRVKLDGRHVAGFSGMSALALTTESVEHREGGDSSSRRKPIGTPRRQ